MTACDNAMKVAFKVLPTYLYGYMRRKASGVLSFVRSIIVACLVGLFVGLVLGYAAFKMPETPWFYYPIVGAVLVTVSAGLFLFAPIEWFREKREGSNQSAVVTFLGMIIAVLVLFAGILLDSYKHLEGELTIWSMYETEDGRLADHGDRMDMIAAIQNTGNNPVSIQKVYLAFEDGQQIDLLIEGTRENDNSDESVASSLKYYGFPVNTGEAVRFTLSVEGDKKEEISQKVNDQGFKGCFVEDTSGTSYKLDTTIYLAASDRKINNFTFASNPKEG